MKALIALLAGFLGVTVLLLCSAFLLPRTCRVERTVIISAPAAAVFPWITTVKRWPEWTAWTAARFPDMRLTFDGPESGVGARYHWLGPTSGSGALKLTDCEVNQRVGYELDFSDGKYLSRGSITLEPAGSGVRVRWTNEGDLGSNPFNRWFGFLMMDRMLGDDLLTGLVSLKTRVETPPRKY